MNQDGVLLGGTTLETSEKDDKIHSKRVRKMIKYTRNEWRRCQITLESSEKDVKIHSKRVRKITQVFHPIRARHFVPSYLPHSFRVENKGPIERIAVQFSLR